MRVQEVLDEAAHAWPVASVALGVLCRGEEVVAGDASRVFPLASVTKLLSAYATLVAVEEETVSLEDRTGPPGVTLRHLMSHAAGIAPNRPEAILRPEERRLYSNAGCVMAAAHVEACAGIPFGAYLAEAVLEPAGMSRARLSGSPAGGAECDMGGLLAFAAELLDPRLVSKSTRNEAFSIQYPSLRGILPGFGMQDPNPWGLGFEVRGAKTPHWTGHLSSEQTVGHFGQTGTFLWVEPDARLACCALTDRPFGDWARELWPALSDAVISAVS